MARDAEDTKRRLLEAAANEFAERGIAGARVDRIAAAAAANKALIYSYFGNKEDLFDAVFNALVVDTVEDVPIDADDLPGYAGRLFDHGQEQPQVLRLALWHSLERGGAAMPEAVVAANLGKVEAIAAAQRDGRITDRFPAGELMVLITGLSILGAPDLALTHFDGPEGLAERRRTVVESVRILITKDEK
ncbi:TetR family transcriptional regulator [Actinoplanes friuliensis]|uniref:TetR family transcriptional regulator n=1 Tax=Actinoplanes friuliensis DSM 7358 TaxID=1246995 RepID=U5W6R5_9ACTN|nr:TetR family transcriptional regulator [Actinoplanes friuliensis]AGZ44697.1 TetR family transcriptional regulator [Actinoplanes friuliensis DSM 7358]